MINSDGSETSRPSLPVLVDCEICRQEIRAYNALTEEGEDYLLWFCGTECYAEWRREHPPADSD